MNKKRWALRPIVLAVSGCFAVAPVYAGPTGPQVVNGAVSIQGLGTPNVNVTNSPGAIIHWQGFSIGASEVTRFIQQSASSAVLNRVVGADISSIQGQLLSNGRVFLINPAGIIIGAGAMIDTAGFVGSTLNMQNADFLAGKLKFQGDANSGSIVNQGWIKAGVGGNIILVAPTIENRGVLQTEGGQLILAAGQKLTIGSLDLEGVQFEIQAPADSVINVGKLLANNGAVGVFAGTLRHSGDIRANALARDEAGRVVLKARDELNIAAGSTITASGNSGGDILLQAANGQASVAGEVRATGSAGHGGDIRVLGERVSLVDNALIDASGSRGGGQIRVGGDFQGTNAAIQNASHALVGPGATLRADATAEGTGGRVIVWADQGTLFQGKLSARGGPAGGNGGFAEVSGKENLVFAGNADLGAPRGRHGDLLLDPLDLFIANLGGSITSIIDEPTDVAGNAVTITPAALAGIAGNVTLQAGRYMRFSNPVTLTTPGQTLTAIVDTWTPTQPAGALQAAFNRIDIGASITTAGGAVTLTAPAIHSFAPATITTGGGAITLNTSGATIQASQLALNAGTGAALAQSSSSIQLGAITGGSLTASISGALSTGNIATTGPVSLTSSGNSISTGTISSGGGNVTANASSSISTGSVNTAGGEAGGGVFLTSANSSVSSSSITSGGNNIAVTARFGVNPGAVSSGGGRVDLTSTQSSVNTSGQGINAVSGPVTILGTDIPNTGVIATTGTVNLNATQGTITSTVNNTSGLTATATRSNNAGASVTINSTSNTALNASTVTATQTGCFSFFSCPSATVNISSTGTGGVNVGMVSASAQTSGNNTLNESVSVTATNGPIRGLAGALITAADVTLATGQGSGGGIMGASPLNVNVKRTFNFRPNGPFEVNLNGTGPNQLFVDLGVAPTASPAYTGTLTRTGGGLAFTANATDTTVTLTNVTLAGFNQRVNNTDPAISFRVPNGVLNVPTITVPEGDTAALGAAALPVTIRASGNVVLGSYTRQSTPQSLAKATTITSDNGTVTLGTINASKDAVTVTAAGNVSISSTSLTTAGDVSITSTAGNIAVGRIDTTSGTGAVTLSAASGQVGALADDIGVEVRSGSTISVTGQTIGTPGFANPLDLQGNAITLTSRNTGGTIGTDNVAVIANTTNLTIDAASAVGTNTGARFHVNTGATALQNLSVTANPGGVEPGGPAVVFGRVRTEVGGANDKTYVFLPRFGDFVFNPGVVPATQFAGGLLSFTSHSGNIILGNSGPATNFGATGALGLNALTGSIDAQTGFDGRALTLNANTSTVVDFTNPVRTIQLGVVGGTVPAESVSITAGANNRRSGSLTASSINTAAGGTVTINTYGAGGIVLGPNGNDPIGSPARRAGTVTLNANDNNISASGPVRAGNIFADIANVYSRRGAIGLAGDLNIDATTSISLRSGVSVATGTLDAPSILIDRPDFSSPFTGNPTVTTRAIGGVRPVESLTINNASSVAIGGALTGDVTKPTTIAITSAGALSITGTVAAGNDSTIDLHANGGALSFGPPGVGTLTPGGSSTISLTHTATTALPFSFATLNAGATGSVTINSGTGIQQTADLAGNGIFARDVTLTTGTGVITNTADVVNGRLDLHGTSSLTVTTGGAAAFDAHGGTLGTLTVMKSTKVNTSPFILANLGSGQTVAMTNLAPGTGLTVNSPNAPLNFTFTYNDPTEALVLAGPGIVTGGGFVNVTTSGLFDGSTGGITTGGPDGGGRVDLLSRGGSITTGAINTTPTGAGPAVTPGGGISIVTNCPACDIIVSGNLQTGPDMPTGVAGSIGLTVVTSGSVTRTGGATISSASPDSVSITTPNGNIGTVGAPMLITTPTATLSAGGTTGSGIGNVFATLTDTVALTLTGDNGFNVTSTNTGLDSLSLSTRGTGVGPVTLNAVGQTYAFARPAAGTFQILTAAGATPPTSASFTASDGDLLLASGANVIAPDLTLQTTLGDVRLQGTAGALSLVNPTQTINAGRDLLINGDVTLGTTAGTTTQTLSAVRHITAQAQGGSIAIGAANQTIRSTTSAGTLSFLGGGAADERVTVTANASQLLQTPDGTSGSILLRAGAGDRSSVTVSYTGTGTQTVEAGGNIELTGGLLGSTDATALITTGTGSQLIRANIDMLLTGGGGTRASAAITNTGTNNQQVGEARRFCCFHDAPYQTNIITLQGGPGADSFAEINAAGPQQVFTRSGTLNLLGGPTTGSFARIENASASSQNIGESNYFTSILNMLAGAGAGAYSRIRAAGQQTIRASTSTTLTAGTGSGADALIQSAGASQQTVRPGNLTLTGGQAAGTTAKAQIDAAGSQRFESVNALTLLGGAGVDSIARITTPGAQIFNAFQSLTMTGGTHTGAFAKIDAGGTQSLTGGGSNIMLTAGGTAATPLGNAGATIEGHSQFLSCGFNCNLTLTGGAGLLGNTSDALLRNLSGNQSINAHSITLNGGVTHSTAGILNPATGGTQTVTTSNAAAGNLSLTSHLAGLADAPVLIQNLAPTLQTITSARGVALNNRAAGPVSITSAGTQNVQGQWIDVLTSAGSTGNSVISAAGNQFLRTTNGATAPAGGASARVAALGSGLASIDTAATQLLESEYLEHMTTGANPPGSVVIGNAAGAGISRVQGLNQSVFARTITVQGGLVAGSTAKLTGTNTQTLSTLDGSINVRGGGGTNATAAIDPLIQTIVANGNVALTGGNAVGATASILSTGVQTVFVTKGNTTLLGGAAAGASASIEGHSQSLTACATACSVTLTGGAGIAGNPSDALLRNLSGAQTVSVGSLMLVGGLQFSTAGIINTLGAGAQSVTAGGGGISLASHANAEANASVVIENRPATAQTIIAITGDTALDSRGAGSVAITSAGTQSIDTRGLDVVTHASAQGGANATVLAVGDQTIRARGALPLPQPAGSVDVGVRVAARSTGTAKIESGANQILNVGLAAVGPPDTFVEGQLLIGSLSSLNPSDPTNIALGNSLVQSTNAAAPGGANQTVRAASIQVQGPSGNFKISKLSADGTQVVTTILGGISAVGGSGQDSFAIIDPTHQTITSFGNLVLQGGTGPNADAIINATGPQTVTSLTGQVQLFGGSGSGADALIVTTSPSQSVTGQGANFLQQGPAGGGIAGLQFGTSTTDTGGASAASTTSNHEQVRTESSTQAAASEEEDRENRFRAQTCS